MQPSRTLTVSSRASTARGPPRIYRQSMSSTVGELVEHEERLHEWLTQDQIEEMRLIFENHPEQKLNYNELRETLRNFNILFPDHQFQALFLKINQNRDYKCDWNEFISHLILGFQEDDPNNQKEALIQPVSLPPVVKKSEHRSPVVAITVIKNVSEGSEQDVKGTYLTASKEGTVKFWSSELEVGRTELSDGYHFRKKTLILCIQALSDVGVVCTSSADWELRFFDASNFSLRIIIRTMPFTVFAMAYSYKSLDVTSKLVLGDYDGNIRILEFSPILRGPFQSKPGTAMVHLEWNCVLKGKYPSFRPKEYFSVHTEKIQKLFYSIRMNLVFSCAEYRDIKKYRGVRCPGMVIYDVKENSRLVFKIPLGVSTFFIDETNRVLATGGPDTYLRLWDPLLTSKPSAILGGHHAGIVMVFIQPEEKKVYSLDYLKILKVWHLTEQNLLQTFGDLIGLIPNEMRLAYYYNRHARELLIGGRKLVAVKCCPKMRMDLTDGNTHAAPVSVVMYNKLFRNVVTCGLDSYIIVWDPWTGKRQIIMKNCHTRTVYGEVVDVEITTACFDPMEQLLLTGARDGSLKVWNYNSAVCIRNMAIEHNCEVTAVAWVEDRILAVGWNRHITEFADSEGQEFSDAKNWATFHGDDVTCADVKCGEGLVTGTYSGEIIFWKLETGQPYRKYNVSSPKAFLELSHSPKAPPPKERSSHAAQLRISKIIRKSISLAMVQYQKQFHPDYQGEEERPTQNAFFQDNPSGHWGFLKSKIHPKTITLPISVQAVLFLQTRAMAKDNGSLLVALDNGMIQVYSHHQLGGYIAEFNTAHKTGDCVLTMATDKKNRYLFTGTAFGYIKIWLVQNYCLPESKHTPISMPKLRLQFIFLRKDRFPGRAKRITRHQQQPMLLSSFKGHTKAITSILYVFQPRIILTGSHDCSTRLWSLGGRYLGTLGTPLAWLNLSPFDAVNEEDAYRLPPDIKKVASSTTLKVLSGVYVDKLREFNETVKMERNISGEGEKDDCFYGKPLTEPILGKHFQMPARNTATVVPVLDTTLSHIPVYQHLEVHETAIIKRPPTPEALKKTKALEFMDYYEAKGE